MKRTLRVLVITHAGGSPLHGPNMRWYYLGRALKSLGVEVEIVSSSSFHKYTSPPVINESYVTESVNGLTYHWLKTRPYNTRGIAQVANQAEFVFSCYRHGNRLADRKPDVIVASSPHPFVVFPAHMIARKTGARLVYEVRDLWPEVLLELGKFHRWHPYILALKCAERHGVKHAERIISVKPGDGDYFAKEYGLPVKQFSYVANGFLPEVSEQSPPDLVQQIREKYQFVIGYVGALSSYYGLDRLISLAEKFRDRREIAFVVVGKGDQTNKLRQMIEQSGLDNVYLIGPIPKLQVGATLAEFDACYVGLEDLDVHRYGVSCNKIYEYMYAGKPIIGSYSAGYDPVKAAECGFVAPAGDYSSLIEGIEYLMANPEAAQAMGQRGRLYFDANHDFRVVARKLKCILFPEEDVSSGSHKK